MITTPLNQSVDYSHVYPITEDLRDEKILYKGRKEKIGTVIKQTPNVLTIKWEEGNVSKLCVAHAEKVKKYFVVRVA